MSVEDDLRRKLERTHAELRMLYEISNALRSTLKLNEILYMILTAITCKEGLGFNRAMLFLANNSKSTLNGMMAILILHIQNAQYGIPLIYLKMKQGYRISLIFLQVKKLFFIAKVVIVV